MFFEDQNGYITASYMLTAVVFAGLIFWVLSDRAKQKKALQNLEAQGVTRRERREKGA